MSETPSANVSDRIGRGADRAVLLAVVAALGLLPKPLPADAAVTALKAFHREGQTFLTWKEDESVKGEWYRVYAADRPITAENLEQATFIAKIPEGSREYRFLADAHPRLKKILAKYKWSAGIQIEDDDGAGKILPAGTGVFVRTVKEAGNSCYAVTVERDGKEDGEVAAGVNSLKAPLVEAVETPGAIRLQKYDDRYFAYLFFTDFEIWNPDKVDDNWEGYAHVFHVRVPDPKRARGTKPPFGLSVRLHAYTAWQGWDIPYCHPRTHVNLRLLDYHLTWWYGYSDAMPKVEGGRYARHPVKGKVVNFTEQRVLQAVEWIKKRPRNFPARVDPMRVSVFGGSMGGSGVNVFGMRHGDVFAGAWGCKGITNWALPPKHNSWHNNIRAKVGPLERNDPTNEGRGVYDVLNMPKWLAEHPEIDTPYLDIANGMVDGVITFHSVPDYWRGLEKGKHPYAAGWEMVGHPSTLGSGGPMSYLNMRLDESLPALANASCNTPMRSGFRMMGKAAKLTEKTLTIAKGSFPPNLDGKTLVLGATHLTRKWFTIKSNTAKALTVAEGDMLKYRPKLTRWTLGQMKAKLKREPTEGEKSEEAGKRRMSFLICDGLPRGTWNGHFAWSSRGRDFDAKRTEDDVVDEADRWAICLRLHDNKFSEWTGETATVDVTPRRCRKFRLKPGQAVHWRNLDCSDPDAMKKIAEGEVTADKYGLVTVPKVTVGRKGWGNRLVLTRKKGKE